MDLRTVRTYQGTYTIARDDNAELYYCLNAGETMLKANKKPAGYKNLTLAEKFIIAAGAQEIPPAPKKTAWTMPVAAVIAPLEEQLAALPNERFVVIEVPYSLFGELGYAVYDRVEKESVHAQTFRGRNGSKTEDRAEAEAELAYCKEHGIREKIEVDMNMFSILADAADRYENRFEEPLPEHEKPAIVEDEITIASQEKVGSIIDYRSDRWTVIHCEYLTEKDVAEMEDGFDIFVSAGWHSSLVRVKESSANAEKS
jgi:hypothetical protein